MSSLARRALVILGMAIGSGAVGAAGVAPSSVHHFRHLGSDLQQQKARDWNRSFVPNFLNPNVWSVQRPFSEIETTGYVVINGSDELELPALREAIAKNLPSGVTLVVYVGDESEIAALKTVLGPYLDGNHLKFLLISTPANGDPLWARDSMPFPVVLNDTSLPTGLVGSIYPQDFDPDSAMAAALGLPLQSTGLEFRGGNLLFDLAGNCFAENANELAHMSNPQGFLQQFFGCKSVTLLNQQGGIGDIDERLKFLNGQVALTDNDSYASLLQARGYDVHRIPATGVDGETYMNTLIVNGTIFVPQMNLPSDASALAAYRALGFNPVGVVTKQLADQDDGNIHCLTMNYPPGTFVQSAKNVDLLKFRVTNFPHSI